MNYTEMLFNRDERLIRMLNDADNKNLELIVEINKKEEELERYKNIIDELKKEKSKKYDYVREVRTFNNNISKKDLEKFPVLKQYQGKDISYIVYESIDIL